MRRGTENLEKGPLETYAQEVLRWNRQMNLVSRQDSAQVLQGLLDQCVRGFDALWVEGRQEGWFPEDLTSLQYFDLGSGGGLPGVIWHHLLTVKGYACSSWMVEPRDKRAWFLDRVAQIPDVGPFGVLQGRWGEVERDNPTLYNRAFTLISLKALHLTDPEVLAGLIQSTGGSDHGLESGRIVIARYYPADQAMDAGLCAHLDLPSSGGALQIMGQDFTWEGASLVKWTDPSPRAACLVVSRYTC
jgi:16S rRNA G527 N7-methylase RsmG